MMFNFILPLAIICILLKIISIEKYFSNQKIKKIGERAFLGCHALKSVMLPKSVNKISYEALLDNTTSQIENFLEKVKKENQI